MYSYKLKNLLTFQEKLFPTLKIPFICINDNEEMDTFKDFISKIQEIFAYNFLIIQCIFIVYCFCPVFFFFFDL